MVGSSRSRGQQAQGGLPCISTCWRVSKPSPSSSSCEDAPIMGPHSEGLLWTSSSPQGPTFKYRCMVVCESFTHTVYLKFLIKCMIWQYLLPLFDDIPGVVSPINLCGLCEEGSLAHGCLGTPAAVVGKAVLSSDDVSWQPHQYSVESNVRVYFWILSSISYPRSLPYSFSFSELCVFQTFSRLIYLLCVPCIFTWILGEACQSANK